MYPILARYGPFFLYSYAVIAGLGCLLALALTGWMARRRGITGWLDGVLWAALVALMVGRTVFVWLNAPYFAEHPGEAWRVWLGGVNHQAALLSGLLAYYGWCRLTGRPFAEYAGLVAPGLAIVVAAFWSACWFDGCAYGREGVAGLLTSDLPDSFGVMAVRYRVQLVGALLSLAVAGVALLALRRWPPLAVFWLTLLLLSSVALIVGPFRGDWLLAVGQTPAGMILDGVVALISAMGLVLAMREIDVVETPPG